MPTKPVRDQTAASTTTRQVPVIMTHNIILPECRKYLTLRQLGRLNMKNILVRVGEVQRLSRSRTRIGNTSMHKATFHHARQFTVNLKRPRQATRDASAQHIQKARYMRKQLHRQLV